MLIPLLQTLSQLLMITNTSWIVVRHPYAFSPQSWQVVLCKRDMTAEVMPGVQERRFMFTVDVYSGNGWLREGSGSYEYWTHLPNLEKWCPARITPPLNTRCIFCINSGQYAGLHIGQVTLDTTGLTVWKIRELNAFSWTPVLSKTVGGWLMLPLPH